ncbi:hypothetical protein AHF37_00915 [Paragonimus kellicotti]|nr:hypothetical protein AHF37_00915 [Paragonimus kellicotti]
MLESNYLYGHVNGTARHLMHPRDCYSFDLVASPPLPLSDVPQMNNGNLELQFAVARPPSLTLVNRQANDSSSYTLASQLGLRSSPSKDEDLMGNKLTSMNCSSSCSSSLLWLDGPDTQREPSSYCTLMDSHDSFLVQHSSSSDCVDQTSGTLTTLEPGTPVEELYTTYERMDTSADEGTAYVNDHYSGVTEARATVGSSATEAVETRRDKITGKYKQTNNSTDQLAGPEKRCKVCGDRAVNHNFGQLTCESCKAFFRRNAHKLLPTFLDPTPDYQNSIAMTTESEFLRSLSRPQCFVELTCTSKTGEHEITPATRRECPACRLKKCFFVGMRPDLIQVRKKDGSKPRWLDKVPSAAIVHEKHLQVSELNGKSSWPPNPKATKSYPGTQRASKQYARDYREDVCSTDSGSCISLETCVTAMGAQLELQTMSFGVKRQKPTTTGISMTNTSNSTTTSTNNETSAGILENADLFDVNQCGLVPDASGRDTQREVPFMVNLNSPAQFVESNCNAYPIEQGRLEFIGTATSESGQIPLIVQSCPGAMTDFPHPVLVRSSGSACCASVVHLNPENATTPQVPKCLGISANFERKITYAPLVAISSTNQSITKVEPMTTMEDVILVANTPRILVPTNVVTIGTATALSNNAVSINTGPINSTVNKTIGSGLNRVELTSSNANGSIQYTTYARVSPNQGLPPTNGILLESPTNVTNQPILTPLWSPASSTTIHNGLIHVGATTESILSSLVPALPKCVLATSIRPLTPISQSTLLESATCLNHSSPFAMSGATSFHVPVNSVSGAMGTDVTVTALIPSITAPPMHHTQLVRANINGVFSGNINTNNNNCSIPTQTTLLLPNPVDTSLVLTQSAQSLPCSSFLGVVSDSIIWTVPPAASTTTTTANVTSHLFHTNLIHNTDDDNNPSTALPSTKTTSMMFDESLLDLQYVSTTPETFVDLHWQLPTGNLSKSDPQSQPIGEPVDNLANMSTCLILEPHSGGSMTDSMPSSGMEQYTLNAVHRAWSAMWNNGLWPNPSAIDLNIDTDQLNPVQWRMSIGSLWTEVFLRRIAVFALTLFGGGSVNLSNDLAVGEGECSQSPSTHPTVTQFPSTISDPSRSADPITEHSMLTWEDMLWLLKHRFSDCVPVLLIGCLVRDVKLLSTCPPFRPTVLCQSATDRALNPNDSSGSCSTPFSPLRNSVLSSRVTANGTPLNGHKTGVLGLIDSNVLKTPWSNSLGLDGFGLPATPNPSESDLLNARAEKLCDITTGKSTIVHFHCEPGVSTFLNLTNLGNALAHLPQGEQERMAGLKDSCQKQSTYLILQYLDAYVSQFGSFLAYRPALIGTFMALKLTDPSGCHCCSHQKEPGHSGGACKISPTEKLTQLHEHFTQVFSNAADFVALSSSYRTSPTVVDNETTTTMASKVSPQEVAAAHSRRAMLQDFLTWSRQFDTAWRALQRDTWNQSQQLSRTLPTSGLTAIFSESSSNSPASDELVDFLSNAHRFSDCVPVLLIGCLVRDVKLLSTCPPFRPTVLCQSATDRALNPNDSSGSCSTPFSPLRNSVLSSRVTANGTPLNGHKTGVLGLIDSNVLKTPWSNSLGLDGFGLPATPNPSESDLLNARAEKLCDITTGKSTIVHFHCEPGVSTFLNLTNLGNALAHLPQGEQERMAGLKDSCQKQSTYLILQYLDAYVSQFGSFLAYRPALIGTFMALKLTDPSGCHCCSHQKEPGHSGGACKISPTEKLTQLHEHFTQVFSNAADFVALSSSYRTSPTVVDNETTTTMASKVSPQEVAAAHSRRAMLQDFLTWSRQFDTAWRALQRDTWNQSQQLSRTLPTSGLTAIFSESSSNSPASDELVDFLSNAVRELTSRNLFVTQS